MNRARYQGFRISAVFALVAASALSAGAAQAADVTIDTVLLSGDPTVIGSQLRVQVNITEVNTTLEPSGVALKILFPTTSVTWGYDPSPAPNDELTVENWPDPDGLGPLTEWSASGSSSNESEGAGVFSRRVSTFGGPIPTGTVTPSTPWGCFIVNFTVVQPSTSGSFNIEVAPDTTSSAPIAALVTSPVPSVQSLSGTFNRTGTTFLAPTPTPSPTPVTSVPEWLFLD